MVFIKKYWLELLVFTVISILFLTKLDYYYFFTDEILYVQVGKDHLAGIYEDTLQVPPLPKLIAGVIYTVAGRNLFLLRLPFAILGIASAYLIYLTLKKEFPKKFAVIGVILFATNRIIFDSTRMVMLEPLMHFAWLAFLYFYYETFYTDKTKTYILSGLFLGLSLAIKMTSIVLLPFILLGLLYKRYILKSLDIKRYFAMGITSLLTILVTYLHSIYSVGIKDTIIDTLKEIKNVYFKRNDEGKTHVIGDSVFTKSPWWAYIYYNASLNGLVSTITYLIFPIIAFFKRNFFVIYYSSFFVLTFIFLQIVTIKNFRYISSLEIPLIMLVVAGMHYVASKFPKHKIEIFGLITIFIISHVAYLFNLQHTEYLGLLNYFRDETNNFTVNKRLYVFGSIRTMQWYRSDVPDKNMFIYRRDYDVLCPELNTFDYIAFDKEELMKAPDNYLYQFVKANETNFEKVQEINDMLVFRKTNNFVSTLPCFTK